MPQCTHGWKFSFDKLFKKKVKMKGSKSYWINLLDFQEKGRLCQPSILSSTQFFQMKISQFIEHLVKLRIPFHTKKKVSSKYTLM